MIERTFVVLAALLLAPPNPAWAQGAGAIEVIPHGMARLIVERADELILNRQEAVIALNGRPIGSLAAGGRLQINLAPGAWRLSVRHRPSAEPTVLPVALKAGSESRVRVELDPVRFPPEKNALGIGNLLRQSIDAPNDDRLPLFRLRQVVAESPAQDR